MTARSVFISTRIAIVLELNRLRISTNNEQLGVIKSKLISTGLQSLRNDHQLVAFPITDITSRGFSFFLRRSKHLVWNNRSQLTKSTLRTSDSNGVITAMGLNEVNKTTNSLFAVTIDRELIWDSRDSRLELLVKTVREELIEGLVNLVHHLIESGDTKKESLELFINVDECPLFRQSNLRTRIKSLTVCIPMVSSESSDHQKTTLRIESGIVAKTTVLDFNKFINEFVVKNVLTDSDVDNLFNHFENINLITSVCLIQRTTFEHILIDALTKVIFKVFLRNVLIVSKIVASKVKH